MLFHEFGKSEGIMMAPFRCLALTIVFLFALLSHSGFADPLKIGTARVDLEPMQARAFTGYASRGDAIPQGIHDPLEVRAIVLEANTRVLLITCDLLALDSELISGAKDELQRRLGIPAANILVACIHTHGGPACLKTTPVKAHPAYRKLVEQKITEAGMQAFAAMHPAQFGFGTGRVDLSYNRRVKSEDGSVKNKWSNPERIPLGPVDPDVLVASFMRPDATPLGILFNYACHPVVMGPQHPLFTADYPGAARRYAEQSLHGSPLALMTLGACADLNPYVCGQDSFGEMQNMGRSLATEVLNITRGIRSTRDVFIRAAATTVTLAVRNDTAATTPSLPFRVPVQVIAINDLALVGIPGELFVELGQDIKRASPFKSTWIVTMANDVVGYIPTRTAFAEGGYEVESSFNYYGLPPLGPGCGETIRDAATALLKSLAQK
jgi:neutral ceramidase